MVVVLVLDRHTLEKLDAGKIRKLIHTSLAGAGKEGASPREKQEPACGGAEEGCGDCEHHDSCHPLQIGPWR